MTGRADVRDAFDLVEEQFMGAVCPPISWGLCAPAPVTILLV